MPLSKEKLIDKVRKLLALAGNNSNIHEASLAAELAQKLIMEHNLSIVDLDNNTPVFSSFEQESKVDPWRRILANDVALSLNGHCFFDRCSRGSSNGKFVFSGPNDSAESMAFLFMYIVEQLEALNTLDSILNKSKDIHGKSRRSAWFSGAIKVISKRLQQRKSIIGTESNNSQALVLSHNALDKWIKNQFPDLRSEPAAISVNDSESYNRGRNAAEKVNFGDSRIKHGRRELNP